jgi:hypothetical protein
MSPVATAAVAATVMVVVAAVAATVAVAVAQQAPWQMQRHPST